MGTGFSEALRPMDYYIILKLRVCGEIGNHFDKPIQVMAK
jgi:hypothetical protein